MKALIIGGGIGGLTAAIALQKKGIDVQVFEQSPEIKEVGAGIWLAPNGMQIMDRLGFTDELSKLGNKISILSASDINGKPISRFDNEKDGIIKKFGHTHLGIHRASLQQFLYKQIPTDKVITSKLFLRYEESKDKVIAFFSDGSHYEGDLLVGADGIKSLVRKQLLGDIPLRYSGQTCWRGISDITLPADEINALTEVWMKKAGLRSAYTQINPHQVYFYITICSPPNGHDEKGKTKEKLHQLTKGVATLINEVINNTKDENLIRNDLFDFVPLKNWTRGKVALLGDAAHATTPNLGQGANQAIESAYYIAAALAENKNNIEAALRQYQNTRMKKAHYITTRSWQLGQMSNYSSPLAQKLRNMIMRYSPRILTLREFDKVYSLNY